MGKKKRSSVFLEIPRVVSKDPWVSHGIETRSWRTGAVQGCEGEVRLSLSGSSTCLCLPGAVAGKTISLQMTHILTDKPRHCGVCCDTLHECRNCVFLKCKITSSTLHKRLTEVYLSGIIQLMQSMSRYTDNIIGVTLYYNSCYCSC